MTRHLTGRPGRPSQPVPAELVQPLEAAAMHVEQRELELRSARHELGDVVREALAAGASHRSIAAVLEVPVSHVGRLAKHA